jgi:3,4-dihydroxy 2-butanone 4-phosphate synthase / GTP cyclohydrolase II
MTTDVSAYDGAQTILDAIDSRSRPNDLGRTGHLAGLNPPGVTCEIMNDDGTEARLPELARFCVKHALKMLTVGDLAGYGLECDDNLVLAWPQMVIE